MKEDFVPVPVFNNCDRLSGIMRGIMSQSISLFADHSFGAIQQGRTKADNILIQETKMQR